ncbi:MAG: thioredoxin family protein [Pirellulales bacterium]
MLRYIATLAALGLLATNVALADDDSEIPGALTVTAQFSTSVDGAPAQLFITAEIPPGWHTFSIDQPSGGPLKTIITVDKSDQFKLTGEFQSDPAPSVHPPSGFAVPTREHEGTVTWFAPIEIAAGVDPQDLEIHGSVKSQRCEGESRCVQRIPFEFTARLGSGVTVSAAAGQPQADPRSLLVMMGFGFIGGIILNLMPCVLPVIGLKIMSFVQQSGKDRGRILKLNLWYTAGVLAVFMVLATLAAGAKLGLTEEGLGWGQQFGSTGFNVVMSSVVFVMALSFLGVWDIPIPGFVSSSKANDVAAQEGGVGAFTKGALSTILATPCSAPFLGPVFGFTLTQPPAGIYALFISIGLGMSLPYLVIGAFPSMIRFLPKPGLWMDTFKHIMGFVMLGTVVFLFTFLDKNYLVPTFALLVGLWFACWWIGRAGYTATFGQRVKAWLVGGAVSAVVGVFAFTVLVSQLLLPWKPFSRPLLEALSADGHTVMVDFTANWCLTCKYNLKTAIDVNDVNQLVAENRVVPLLADWTDGSAEIQEELNRLNSNSIPVLAIFPPGRIDNPIILRDIVTKSQVLEALKQAGPSKTAAAASTTRPQVAQESTEGRP